MIVRGSTNMPIMLGDYKVPSTAKLLQFVNDGVKRERRENKSKEEEDERRKQKAKGSINIKIS